MAGTASHYRAVYCRTYLTVPGFAVCGQSKKPLLLAMPWFCAGPHPFHGMSLCLQSDACQSIQLGQLDLREQKGDFMHSSLYTKHSLVLFTQVLKTPYIIRGGPALADILVGTQGKGATEPRDRIFAIYDVIQALGIDFPKPDYGKPVEQVYREPARAAIDFDGDLSILCHVTGFQSSASAPSWTPNWGGELGPLPVSLKARMRQRMNHKAVFTVSRRSESA
jgi:hypothetical protein